jgi:hypothetical protein
VADDSGIWDGVNGGCAALYPLWPYFASGTIYPEDTVTAAHAQCFANECFLLTVDASINVFDIEGGVFLLNWASALISCADMLDTNQTDIDTSCIVAKEVEVDSMLITNYIAPIVAEFDTGNWTARTCLFRYECGHSNITSLGPDGVSLGMVSAGLPQPPPRHKRSVEYSLVQQALPELIAANAGKFQDVVKRRK